MKHVIRGVSFDPDSGGFVIEFLTPEADIRATGLVLNHALLIPAEEAFIDLLTELEESIQSALQRALQLHADGPAIEVEEQDEPGPYDNPLER